MKPLVTIIVATYNQREYVAHAIESALGQAYDNIEVIVVDNGSTDGSQAIIRRYGSDPRVRLVLHERNIHVTRKMNESIALARGELISILQGDDYYLPHKIDRQVAIMQQLPADYGVVYGPAIRLFVATGEQVVVGGIRKSGGILPELLNFGSDGFIDLMTALFRRQCLERYRFYDDLFVEGEAIFYRIALSYKFQYCEEPLVVMRDHATNLGKNYNFNLGHATAVLDRLEHHPEFPHELRPDLYRLKTRLLRDNGWQNIRVDADTATGTRRLMQAVRRDWRQAFHPRVVVGLAFGLLPAPMVHRGNEFIVRTLRLAKRLRLR